MADFGTNMKNIWMKGMEAIGRRASDIASNTKFKVDEMNMVNRRAEIMKDFGARAYALWQKGEQFPEELAVQLKEVSDLDEKLNDMRAERIASVKEAPIDTEEKNSEEYAEPAEEEESELIQENNPDETDENVVTEQEEDPGEVPVIQVENTGDEEDKTTDLSEAINDIFEKIPSVDEAAEKVNGALDSLENGLKQFSDGLDSEIDRLSDQINGKKEE